MKDKLCCFVCEHYQAELHAVLSENQFADVHYTVFSARCGHPPLTPDELTAYETAMPVSCQTLYLLGGSCLHSIVTLLSETASPSEATSVPGTPSPHQHSRIIYDVRKNCFALFVNTSIVEQFIREGKYLITPGWLFRCQQHIEDWGFDQPTARAFFGEWATHLLLLDTGVDPNAAHHLQEFSDFLQLPGSIFPVGLDVFRLRVERMVDAWRMEQQHQKTGVDLSDASKKLADYAMLSHMFKHIATITSEDDVIQRIIELFTMVCAPTHVSYLPVVQGEPGQIRGHVPDSTEITGEFLAMVGLQAPYAWTESQDGFYLRISHQEETVGLMKIDTFTFPVYKEHYLNLAQNIATLCGLAIANARRYQHLEIANKALQKAKEAADSANQAKSLFLSNMSHEFRTPLNGILGYAQILLRDPSIGDRQREQIEILKRSGEHLLSLIVDILDIAKIEAHRIELEPSPVHLAHFLKTLSEMVEIRATHKGLRFVLDVSWSELPRVIFIDEKRLRQVLLNLLSNAIKFTEQGSVTLKVRNVAELKELDGVSTHQLRFEIEDTGIGIDPEQLEAIFAPFEQVHYAHYYAEGTGLGLAISQQLVRLMGSELYVKSLLTQGSTFWFELTLPEILETHMFDAPHADKQLNIVGIKQGGYRILIVDDSVENQQFLDDILAPLGFTLLKAGNGPEAIDIAQAQHPEAILMDLMMPEMDGFDTIRRIRQIPELHDVAIIVVTANASPDAREEALHAGCQEFLTKPVEVSALLNSLQHHLHIEWTYEEAQITQEEVPLPDTAHSLPPYETLSKLYNLAVIGDIFGIRDFLDSLEHAEPSYIAFVSQIRDLARSFQITTIQEVLQTMLADSEHGSHAKPEM
jgi:signal transduction histidine kinase/DNA-binding NarL/FixJ family response regulator